MVFPRRCVLETPFGSAQGRLSPAGENPGLWMIFWQKKKK